MGIVPGQNYTFFLNATDPGLAESSGTFFEGFEGDNNGYDNPGWTISGGGTWNPDDKNEYAGTDALSTKSTGGALAWDEINVSTENYSSIIFSLYYMTAGTFEAGEYIAADYWNGSAWINVLNTSNVAAYTLDNNTLGNDADDNSDFKIRLGCLNDAPSEYCYWDNIQITGTEMDSTNPVINEINDTPDPVDPGATINFTANVTDNVDVSAAWVGIEGTNYSMTQSGSTDIWYYDTFDTNIAPGTYNYTVYANDTTNNPATPVSGNFTINTLISLSLTSAPINFTSVQPGNTVNASVGFGWPVYVENIGNVNENVSVKGTNLVGETNPAYTITVINVEWDTVEAFPTGNPLTFTYEQLIGNLSVDDNVTVYFRLNAPLNIISQNYTGNVSFTSVQT
jgi:hypothetical protein